MRYSLLMSLLLFHVSVEEVFSKKDRCFEDLCQTTPTRDSMKNVKKLLKGYMKKLIQTKANVIGPVRNESRGTVMRGANWKETQLCDSSTFTFWPSITKQKGWTVVNIKKIYEQRVVLEVCKNEGKQCKVQTENLIARTKCKQIFSYVRFLYINEKNSLEFKPFKVPTACVCVLETYRPTY